MRLNKATRVSIHAPAGGATQQLSKLCFRYYCFNPRTRRGCDTQLMETPGHSQQVSIHAPAGGATGILLLLVNMGAGFQSTHPQGVRLAALPLPMLLKLCFNPRTRRGCDTKSKFGTMGDSVFQSTHPQGVRPPFFSWVKPRPRVSIHAPAGGATQWG